MPASFPLPALVKAGVPFVVLLALIGFNLGRIAPDAISTLFQAVDLGDPASVALHYAFLPRLLISLLAGAALGLSGVLFQQLMQNPLAAPDTLAVTTGAQLALTVGLLFFPALQAAYPELLAIGGAFAAWALIGLAARRSDPGPVTLVLTGFIISFSLGSVASLLMMLNQEYVTSLLIWGAGSLVQTDWNGVDTLVWRLLPCFALVLLMTRPLLILGFGDQAAESMGLSLRFARPFLIGVSVLLAASVVSVVGVIGFVGLAAPHLARVLGAQRLQARLLVAPLAGGGLLALVDQALQFWSPAQASALPTGAITALLGTPLLILLLRRLPQLQLERFSEPAVMTRRQRRAAAPILLALLSVLLVLLAVACFVGTTPGGLAISFDLQGLAMQWRFPRVLGAAFAGVALGVAGCLIQRLFGNPMAGPEVLGIGGGVAVGLIITLLLSADANAGQQFTGAAAGALVVTLLVATFGRQGGFAPERLLLIGIAMTALLNAISLLFLAMGDPRLGQVLAWLAGSTYRVDTPLALLVGTVAIAAFALALPMSRWLEILPFGGDLAGSIGVPVNVARVAILLVAALAAAAAALVVGPMSFVGLLAPFLANRLGLRRAVAQLPGAAVIGAILLTVADWIGRVLLAPNELPAGILAILCGLVIALFATRRGRSRMEKR